jgi:hypothetical protein
VTDRKRCRLHTEPDREDSDDTNVTAAWAMPPCRKQSSHTTVRQYGHARRRPFPAGCRAESLGEAQCRCEHSLLEHYCSASAVLIASVGAGSPVNCSTCANA